jgi:hypothetical protein
MRFDSRNAFRPSAYDSKVPISLDYRQYGSGTGLTHTDQRKSMHKEENNDTEKLYQIGVEGGKPAIGQRGAQPEWFYKGEKKCFHRINGNLGNGHILRSHNEELVIPKFTKDGGEEPEVFVCYIIDEQGIPCRVGFAAGENLG